MDESSSEQIAPYSMASEPPLSFRADAYDYDHEVLVTLPASYSVSPDRAYPVLWAMDGAMMHMAVAGIVNMYAFGAQLPEMIVASVGRSSEQEPKTDHVTFATIDVEFASRCSRTEASDFH